MKNKLYQYCLYTVVSPISLLSFFMIATYGCSPDAGMYHTYAEINTELHELADNSPEIATVSSIGQTYEKRQLWAIKISDNVNQNDAEKAVVVLLGGHHAREWISVDVPFLIAKYLIEHYQTDIAIHDMLNNAVVWVVPLVNPDGHQYSVIRDRNWRKNRRLNEDGTYGVDLNRNYGYEWGGPESTDDTCSDFYGGPSPFSEPETQAVRNFLQTQLPDAIITYHSFGMVIKYPWGYTTDPAPDQALMDTLACNMANKMWDVSGSNYIPLQSSHYMDFLGNNIVSGCLTDWYYSFTSAPSFAIELRPCTFYPWVTWLLPERQIKPTFEENLPAALYLIDWAIQQN